MPTSPINKIHEEFYNKINYSYEILRLISKTKVDFNEDQIFQFYEFAFLRIFLAWESFIEDTFVLYMLGNKTDDGYCPKRYIDPKDMKHAYDFFKKGGAIRPSWTNPDFIREKANLFFEDGEPYEKLIISITSNIQDMITLRNSIVHMSKDSKQKLDSLVRKELGTTKPHFTPGEFLYTNKGKIIYIKYYSNRLKRASEKRIAK